MSSLKQPRITNIWSKVSDAGDGQLYSRVVIESTGLFEFNQRSNGNDLIIELPGAVANMPEGAVEVRDGLVSEISLAQTGSGALVVIHMDHPALFQMDLTEGIPARLTVMVNRGVLAELLQGKKIVIDPGHGGEDSGGKGPVNLLEKNVVMLIARELKKLFEQSGAGIVLTRSGDTGLTVPDRLKIAKKEKASLFVSIHTHVNPDKEVGGIAVLYGCSCPAAQAVASKVKEELIKKLKLADRGLHQSTDYRDIEDMPAIEVEVVTITNWVEEGLLRSPTVHNKAAQGIFNGIIKYYADNGRY